mgnify:CR=1 FL=1
MLLAGLQATLRIIKEAETDFYKGWILFLTGFLELEISYLERGL